MKPNSHYQLLNPELLETVDLFSIDVPHKKVLAKMKFAGHLRCLNAFQLTRRKFASLVFVSFVFISTYFIITNLIGNENQSFESDFSIMYSKFIQSEHEVQSLSTGDIEVNELNVNKGNLKSFKLINDFNRIQTTAQEIFNFVSVTLNNSELAPVAKQKIIAEVSDMKNVLKLQVEQLINTLELDQFKFEQLKLISQTIQDKIAKLQEANEFNCQASNQLLCTLDVDAGFASGVHEVLYCLIYGYYHNKTVVLQSEWTKYIDSESPTLFERLFNRPFINGRRDSWEQIFKPVTECRNRRDQIKKIPKSNDVFTRSLVNHLPRDFGARLMQLVTTPNAWFYGQFVGYIMRPQQRLVEHIDRFKRRVNYRHPVVGVQVRRTDKISYGEALFHPLADYMVHVKDYYNKLELTQSNVRKLVYVASDDPTVLRDLIREYPEYEFIGSETFAQLASSQRTRYSNSSLWGLLVDIDWLADADYLVCTFSSAVRLKPHLVAVIIKTMLKQVCRLAFQLSSFRKLDASHSYRSLDVPFHYHHSLTPPRQALFNHRPRSEDQWALNIGSQVYEPINTRTYQTEWFQQAVNGRGWDGYFYGSDTNLSSTRDKSRYKLYPDYKMQQRIRLI